MTQDGSSIPLAVDGETLFAGGQSVPGASTPALGVFGIAPPIPESPPHPPSATASTLTGLAAGKPRLTFKLSSGSNAAPIRSITITVPRGLHFSHNGKDLARGVASLATSGGGDCGRSLNT